MNCVDVSVRKHFQQAKSASGSLCKIYDWRLESTVGEVKERVQRGGLPIISKGHQRTVQYKFQHSMTQLHGWWAGMLFGSHDPIIRLYCIHKSWASIVSTESFGKST